MAGIPFGHEGCNGWAIYESQYIDADNGKNMHVVAGKITYDDGKKLFTPNSALKTACSKQNLKKGNRKYSFASTSDSEIRSKLADFQNQGYEICGLCVSHFHVDVES